jgi:hypothetical protein
VKRQKNLYAASAQMFLCSPFGYKSKPQYNPASDIVRNACKCGRFSWKPAQFILKLVPRALHSSRVFFFFFFFLTILSSRWRSSTQEEMSQIRLEVRQQRTNVFKDAALFWRPPETDCLNMATSDFFFFSPQNMASFAYFFQKKTPCYKLRTRFFSIKNSVVATL